MKIPAINLRHAACFERRRTVNLDAAKASLQGEENTNGQAKKGGAPTNKAMPGAPGRNQPCPCGSGKKYKKCCMQKDKLES